MYISGGHVCVYLYNILRNKHMFIRKGDLRERVDDKRIKVRHVRKRHVLRQYHEGHYVTLFSRCLYAHILASPTWTLASNRTFSEYLFHLAFVCSLHYRTVLRITINHYLAPYYWSQNYIYTKIVFLLPSRIKIKFWYHFSKTSFPFHILYLEYDLFSDNNICVQLLIECYTNELSWYIYYLRI